MLMLKFYLSALVKWFPWRCFLIFVQNENVTHSFRSKKGKNNFLRIKRFMKKMPSLIIISMLFKRYMCALVSETTHLVFLMFTATGHSRLNVLVKTLLLRRTKTQTGESGKPLVGGGGRGIGMFLDK